jgi:hypothetical protein
MADVEMPLQDIGAWLRTGEVVPFLGAGASLAGLSSASRLPTGDGLAGELRDRLHNPEGLATGPLAKVAQYYEAQVDRAQLYAFLRKRFYEDQQGTEIGLIARLLAENLGVDGPKPSIIVTTNYDNQMQRALTDARRDYVVLTHEFGKTHRHKQRWPIDGRQEQRLSAR